MEFHEVFCSSCKKVLGRYNVKFYSEEKIWESIKTSNQSHIRSGHQVIIRKIEK